MPLLEHTAMETVFGLDNIKDLAGTDYTEEFLVVGLQKFLLLHLNLVLRLDGLAAAVFGVRFLAAQLARLVEELALLGLHLPIERQESGLLSRGEPGLLDNEIFKVLLKLFGRELALILAAHAETHHQGHHEE